MTAPATLPDDWSAPDADGVCTRTLDMGAKSTLRGRRLRRAMVADTRVVATWPAAWRDLLLQWLDGAARRRWNTLLERAGNARFGLAHELLEALLRAGLAETDEMRERGQWQMQQVTFIERAALRAALGLPDNEALRAQLAREIATLPQAARLLPLWAQLAEHPPARGLERCALLRTLDAWLAANRFGTRRDFAWFARGATKAVSSAEWQWLESLGDLAAFGIEKHTPALWLRAPLTLQFGARRLELNAVPDVIGLSPDTLAALDTAAGDIGCWRLIENRTSFERAAREFGAADGVIWLPGYAPGWWHSAVRRMIQRRPASALIACDPDPAGIEIALAAGALWQDSGLAWAPWKMNVQDLMQLDARLPLSSHDRVVLQQLLTRDLPATLRELAAWMSEHGEKGEQEGYL